MQVVVKAARVAGWSLIAAGAVVLLYLVYSLFFTNIATERAQAQLQDQWALEVDEVDGRVDTDATESQRPRGVADVDPGGAVAVMQFRRPGSDEPVVHAEPLYVVQGVAVDELMRGPGHYPGTALPGERGNFAVAGHRTTYGAPFYNLDDIQPSDEIHVTGRDGREYVYEVRRKLIVDPGDIWVIAPDPLETGRPQLTLTTCHPRFSNAQRLIVFAERV